MKPNYKKLEQIETGFAHFQFKNERDNLPVNYVFSMGFRFMNCLFFSQFLKECSRYYIVPASDCDEFARVTIAKKYSRFHGRPYETGEVIYDCPSFICSFEEGSSWAINNYALINGFERYLEAYELHRYNENYVDEELD